MKQDEYWPNLLHGYQYKPAFNSLENPRYINKSPQGIIIHSGEMGEGVAEWAWKKEAKYWAHFAWSRTLKEYVQTDLMRHRAPHAGKYNDWLGIEMPGPASLNPRPEIQREDLRKLICAVIEAVSTIKIITAHQFINIKKHDPGPGVDALWFDGLGLDVRWEWVGKSLL